MFRLHRAKGPWDRIHSVFQLPDHQGSGRNAGAHRIFLLRRTELYVRAKLSPHPTPCQREAGIGQMDFVFWWCGITAGGPLDD